MSGPRIALLGFSIECNRFAPVATEADFAARTLLRGDAMVADARSAAPGMLGELPGFIADMDAAGAWEPVPTPAGDGRAERPGGAGVLRPHDGGMGERPARRRAASTASIACCTAPASRRTTTTPKARCWPWCAASSATPCRWSPATTCTPTSRTPTSNW